MLKKFYHWALLGEIILIWMCIYCWLQCVVMYYCVDLTLEQCVPPNVSSDGTFIDGALYACSF